MPKKRVPVESRKSEHHHSILHIRIRCGSKFQPKLTNLIVCTKFARKGYFWSETEKTHLRASLVVTYYIKLFGMGVDRENGILMSLLIVAETKNLN